MFYLLGIAVALVVVAIIGTLAQNSGLAFFGFIAGFLTLFPIYASIIWTFWIGFVKGEPGPNSYGPNPLDAAPSPSATPPT